MAFSAKLALRLVRAMDNANPPLSGVRLASACGVTPQAVHGWRVNGRISKKHLPIIAQMTGQSIAYFLGDADWVAPDANTGRRHDRHADTDTVVVESLTARETRTSLENKRGTLMPDRVIDRMFLRDTWIRSQFPRLPTDARLSVVSAYGSSMEPTFGDGDILLIDTGAHQIEADGIFIIQAQQQLMVKRARKTLTGRVLISSDNAVGCAPEELTEEIKFTVLGKVLWAWTGKRL